MGLVILSSRIDEIMGIIEGFYGICHNPFKICECVYKIKQDTENKWLSNQIFEFNHFTYL